MRVNSICPMDEFDSSKNKTATGENLLRFLMGTECGDLYMLAFDLRYIGLMSSISDVNQYEAGKFLIIEYLGGKLSECHSISYLSKGYAFYGSRLGDSFILKIQQDNTGDKDRRYFTIERTYPCLGNITDLVFRYTGDTKGR